eukprot:TRINITY_DN9681_c0_g12_i2.p1 TRINITY_DN9681_c0_g12~~TRINITY_DN9681_c0_g12_i2.p1  ORF type:complete len:527 (-),score=149.59 TRINITY_DN9681_c0_g12_i2:85-1665(-)
MTASSPFASNLSNERKFIRDSMNITDIEGAHPQKPRERNRLYNAIDYKDVNGERRKFVIEKKEVNLEGVGERRRRSNETIEERVKKIKGVGRKEQLILKQHSRSKGNSEATSEMGEDEEVLEGSEEIKTLNTRSRKMVKNNSDFGRKTEMESTMPKKSNKVVTRKGSKAKQKENISKKANEEIKKTVKGGRRKRSTEPKEWEVYESVSDDDIEEIEYKTKKCKPKRRSSGSDSGRHQEENVRDDECQESEATKKSKQKNRKYNKAVAEKSKKKPAKNHEEYNIQESEEENVEEDEIQYEKAKKKPNSPNKESRKNKNSSSKHAKKRTSDEDSPDDSYDEGAVYAVDKKSILDKFIFFGRDSRDFFSSKFINEASSKETVLHKEKPFGKNSSKNCLAQKEYSKKPRMLTILKEHSNDHSFETNKDMNSKTARNGGFTQGRCKNSNGRIKSEVTEQNNKHPFLKKGSPRAVPMGKTVFGGAKTRSQERLNDTKKVERSSSPTFAYYPKTIVSKPLMRRCGGNVKLVYY